MVLTSGEPEGLGSQVGPDLGTLLDPDAPGSKKSPLSRGCTQLTAPAATGRKRFGKTLIRRDRLDSSCWSTLLAEKLFEDPVRTDSERVVQIDVCGSAEHGADVIIDGDGTNLYRRPPFYEVDDIGEMIR